MNAYPFRCRTEGEKYCIKYTDPVRGSQILIITIKFEMNYETRNLSDKLTLLFIIISTPRKNLVH